MRHFQIFEYHPYHMFFLDVSKCWMCPWAVMNGTDLVTSIKLAPGLSFPYWQSSGMISGWFAK